MPSTKRARSGPALGPPSKMVRRSARNMSVLIKQKDGRTVNFQGLEFEETLLGSGAVGEHHLDGTMRPQRLVEEMSSSSGLSSLDQQSPSESSDYQSPPRAAPKKTKKTKKTAATTDAKSERASKTKTQTKAKPKKESSEAAEDGGDAKTNGSEEEAEVVERAAKRAPAVNSDYLPLPWKGRLGYACLNTYLRASNPPVFTSRTCRIASILDHRYPLQDPTQPEHATKNRPDKTQEPDLKRGIKFAQDLGLANAKDIPKMLRWNDRYGIKFLRLSSEMFPFASHAEYGYKLAPFAADALAEAGRVAAELGHRLTTHPGQYTQIASPRKEVVTAAFRDLEYHDEMLSLLRLPEQQDRDAIMVLHMGGVYGDKASTLDRFRENYARLPEGVRRRLVLENDDVSWCVHDLLPVCEELNIPMVLDFHHNNIIFDAAQIREGTLDIMGLYDRIRRTWTRKEITQKMHYSEPTAGAVTPRDRRKHSARVKVLPPCDPTMDLMIEAKDKEQAVFELMRIYKLPGWHTINDIVPHEREDEPRRPAAIKAAKKAKKSKAKKKPKDEDQEDVEETIEEEEVIERVISPEEFGMGGPLNRVYWPEGMEDWLRPKKREVKKKNGDDQGEAKEVKEEVGDIEE
ncbi:UV-damage endonuclease [Escovopsis weberi]|uniref:UV-damage endonuclease n=1 Tax=Escovopsis weberi TaxID=150374 RepID=A0A0M9VRT7_ESCWE|nr:UV-damage endonuclease [Escovopsis weberi]